MADIIDEITQLLLAHKDKNFVRRILNPNIYPVLNDYAGPDTWGTHLMSADTVNGKTITYPRIVQQPDGNLQLLEPQAALDYALKTNEYIPMESPEQANWFGQNYKKLWGSNY